MALVLNGSGITSANIADGTIVNADINSSAAIDGSKLTGAGKVLQVVSTDYSTVSSTTSNVGVSISGFAATITPSSTSSKILVMVTAGIAGGVDAYPFLLVKRNGTSISTGSGASGSQINTFLSAIGRNDYQMGSGSKNYLDSPSSTSALAYQVYLGTGYGGTSYLNRTPLSASAGYVQYPTSTITLMEIGA